MHGRRATGRWIGLAVVAIWGVFAATATVAHAEPACTPADLSGTKLDHGHLGITLFEKGGDPVSEPPHLRTRRGYTFNVHTSTGQGDHSNVQDGSVQVTGPPAVPVRSVDPNGPQFEFTTAAAGTLRLTMTWRQELFDSRSNLVGVCTVTAPIDLAVLNPQPVKLSARFRSHLVFELRLSNRVEPLDTRSLTVLLRIRRGRAKPPSARGRSTARYTFSPNGFSGGSKQRIIFNVATFEARGTNGATLVNVIPDTTGLRPGEQLRFGFSVEVRQGGRRIGGMRSGVLCHLKRTRLGAEPRCSHPGFVARP